MYGTGEYRASRHRRRALRHFSLVCKPGLLASPCYASSKSGANRGAYRNDFACASTLSQTCRVACAFRPPPLRSIWWPSLLFSMPMPPWV